jgi:hypothetical protein
MMRNKFMFLLLFVAFSSCSPSLSYFTQDLYDRNRWSESELKKIQFYLSDDVYLRRKLGENSSEIVEGKVRMINGEKVEEIFIPRSTPGVFTFSPKANRFAIAFENGSDQRFLMFGPNPKAGERYVLLAKDWERASGKVTYDGKEYEVNYGAAFAGLMVDLRRIDRQDRNSRTAEGVRVN